MRENRKPIALGEFIALLETRPADQRVTFDFGSCVPDDIASYRGYYDHLALGWSEDGEMTVGALLDMCRPAIGKVFEGYKGGHFRMDWGTPLWVANYGRCGSTAVVGIAPDVDYWCIIDTAHVENY